VYLRCNIPGYTSGFILSGIPQGLYSRVYLGVLNVREVYPGVLNVREVYPGVLNVREVYPGVINPERLIPGCY